MEKGLGTISVQLCMKKKGTIYYAHATADLSKYTLYVNIVLFTTKKAFSRFLSFTQILQFNFKSTQK